MLPLPAGEVAMYVKLFVSTPSTARRGDVSNMTLCTCLATDWPGQRNISSSHKTKPHIRHPEKAISATPFSSIRVPTGKLRFDTPKQPPSSGPGGSWHPATRTGMG